MANSTNGMYVINALHEIPILAKRIEEQKEQIRKYASNVSGYREFDSEEKQKEEVMALVRSTVDLVERQRWLKRCVAFTNAVSKLTIEGKTHSVAELLVIKNEMRCSDAFGRRDHDDKGSTIDQVRSVYECLNDSYGLRRQRELAGDKNISVVLYYDEGRKKAELNKHYDFVSKITSELEIFNARALLMDPDDYELVAKKKE